jgi:hypothetical protein
MLNVLNVKFVASGIASFVESHIKALVAMLGIHIVDMMMMIIELRNVAIILLTLFRQQDTFY